MRAHSDLKSNMMHIEQDYGDMPPAKPFNLPNRNSDQLEVASSSPSPMADNRVEGYSSMEISKKEVTFVTEDKEVTTSNANDPLRKSNTS